VNEPLEAEYFRQKPQLSLLTQSHKNINLPEHECADKTGKGHSDEKIYRVEYYFHVEYFQDDKKYDIQ